MTEKEFISLEAYQGLKKQIEETLKKRASRLFQKIENGEMTAYYIRSWDQNDSNTIGVLIADEESDLIKFLVDTYINEESKNRVEIDDYSDYAGIKWNEFSPEECLEIMKEQDPDYDPDSWPCDYCGGCESGITLEPFDPESPEDLIYRVLWGETETYVLTKDTVKKLEDWEPLMTLALKLSEKLKRDQLD
jgi:hypothetical protein